MQPPRPGYFPPPNSGPPSTYPNPNSYQTSAPPPSGQPRPFQSQPYQTFSPPNSVPPYNAPPSGYGVPPIGQPPMGPPPSNMPPPNAPSSGAMPPAPKSNVPFFSLAGGTITPSAISSGPPPSATGMGPPMTGPPMAGPSFQDMQSAGGPVMPGVPPPPSLSMPGPPMSSPPPGTGAAFYPPPPGAGFAGVVDPNTLQPPASYSGQMYGAPPAASMVGMPAAFGSSGSLTPGIQGEGGSTTPNAAGTTQPLPSLAEMDLSIQCDPSFMKATIGKVHNTQAAANTCRVPIGVICRPMAGDKGISNDKIEVVDFGSTGIVRCKRCRTYINPFVSWVDNGRRWRCNICGMLNDVPSTYFSHLDSSGQRRDKDQRPELSRCSVEFVAPGDYMVRPPQPPVYFFVIDVSSVSAQSGMILSCVNAIKQALDELPGAPRTQIGFITFDSSIHFYNLKSSLASPQMHVVSDVSDVILPVPEDLLVNLQESRSVVEALLDALPTMFVNNQTTNTCTGPALAAAKRVIQHVGGKLLLFQSSLPSMGEGSLKPRDNPRLLGTDKEHMLLNPEDPWYKNNAIDFSRLQVAVDTFLFSGQYTDLATISVLSKYTAGQTYYYPGFNVNRDGAKFERELFRCLTRATGFEAVMRVRATRGLRITNFYGNYFVRGTDLLALPNCTSDSTFALDLAYEEAVLSAQVITVQSALLYTSSAGERRIRIHTIILPVTQVIDSVDVDCVVNILTKQAVDIAQKTGLENARQRVHQAVVEMIRGSKQLMAPAPAQPYGGVYNPAQQSPDAPIPVTLQLLPLYSMSIQKCLALRGGTEVRIDERAFYQQLVFNMDLTESKVFIYPRLFSIHDMPPDAGVPCDNAEDEVLTAGPFMIRLPPILNLSHERLASDGIYLLENGFDLFMWIGRAVPPAILATLFGVSSLEGVDMSALVLYSDNSDFSSRVNAVIVALKEDRARFMQLHFIRETDGHAQSYFSRYLVEDSVVPNFSIVTKSLDDINNT